MKKLQIDFCDFIYHDDGILEVIVKPDIEIDSVMAKEYLNFLESIEPTPSQFLVNRINKYSYTFKASLLLASAKVPQNVAVVKYGRLPWPLKGLFTPTLYRLAFFDERDAAINWLKSKKIN